MQENPDDSAITAQAPNSEEINSLKGMIEEREEEIKKLQEHILANDQKIYVPGDKESTDQLEILLDKYE